MSPAPITVTYRAGQPEDDREHNVPMSLLRSSVAITLREQTPVYRLLNTSKAGIYKAGDEAEYVVLPKGSSIYMGPHGELHDGRFFFMRPAIKVKMDTANYHQGNYIQPVSQGEQLGMELLAGLAAVFLIISFVYYLVFVPH